LPSARLQTTSSSSEKKTSIGEIADLLARAFQPALSFLDSAL